MGLDVVGDLGNAQKVEQITDHATQDLAGVVKQGTDAIHQDVLLMVDAVNRFTAAVVDLKNLQINFSTKEK